jgi:hypothetical protein
VLLFYPFVKILTPKGTNSMKKTVTLITSLLLSLVMVIGLCGCGRPDVDGLWADATYTADTQLGEGAKTVQVEVKVVDKSITFTIKTDAETLGDAMLAHDLIGGEEGQYGLYLKVVNGITADYDIDQSYWGFYKNGEYMMTGVDGTVIADGEHYELVYTK